MSSQKILEDIFSGQAATPVGGAHDILDNIFTGKPLAAATPATASSYIPVPEIPTDFPQEYTGPPQDIQGNGIVANALRDLGNIGRKWWDGAGASYTERVKASDATGQAVINSLSGKGSTADYVAAREWEDAANRQFAKDTLGTPALGLAVSGLPGAGAAGALAVGIMGRDAYDTANKSGIGQAVKDLSGYSILEKIFSNPGEFGEHLYTEPLTTTGETAMGLLPAGMAGRALFRGGKKYLGRIREGDAKATLNTIFEGKSEADTVSAPRYTVKDGATMEGVTDHTYSAFERTVAQYNREFPDDAITVTEGLRDPNASYGSPTSYHKSGLGVDIVSPGLESDAARRSRFMEIAKEHGFTEVLDEYSNPTDGATGGHMHMAAPEAKGVFERPATRAVAADSTAVLDSIFDTRNLEITTEPQVSIGQSELQKAYEAAEAGDYRSAQIFADKAGDSTWSAVYQRMREKQEIGDKPIAADSTSTLESIFGTNANDKANIIADSPGMQKLTGTVTDRINQEVGPVSPPAGLSLEITNKTPETPVVQGSKFEFSSPEVETRWQEAAKGIQHPSLWEKTKNVLGTLKNKATRDFEHLPRNGEFAPLREGLRQLQHQKDVAQELAGRFLQDITLKLGKPDYDLFTRKVILDDLQHEKGELPFGFTSESLQSELPRINAATMSNPKIVEALEKRKQIWNGVKSEYTQAMKDIGFEVSERLTREDYFRHQVLEYANMKGLAGTGQRLKTPTNRSFLRKREGSTKDINADYLQAEHEVMAQMIHDIQVAKTIKSVQRNYDIRPQLEKQAAQERRVLQGDVTWRDFIPDRYTTWQPREGTSFYLANSIPERLAKELLAGTLEQVGITKDQLSKVLAKGAPFKELVVKNEVADTLNKLSEPTVESTPGVISRKLVSAWKVWTLTSPTRLLKYNLRNITGDLDVILTGNPRSLKKVHASIEDLYQVFAGDRTMSPEMFEWFKRGGMQSLLQVQELGDIGKLRVFKRLEKADGSFTNPGKKAWEAYWTKARSVTDFREAILRYASYLDYLDQMQKHNGKPLNFGASIPEEIMALKDTRDRAFKLSNELLGAYDSVSVLGKEVRTHVAPFWSWYETNASRYVQLFKNAAVDDRLAKTIAVKTVGWTITQTPYLAYKVGTFALKASAMWSILQAYNLLRYPDEERELPPEEAARPHIILGRDDNGKVKYFSRLGSLGDFLEWFGLDTPAKDVTDYLNGRRTLKEILVDMAKSPANKLLQSVAPTIKLPAETLMGYKTFPDAFKPSTIRDTPLYLADNFGVGQEFKAISRTPMGETLGISPRPGKPYASNDTAENFIYYKSDPDASAYYYIQDEKRRYLKKIGKGGEGGFDSPKSEALRNYKLALRYGDQATADRYLTEYTLLGGKQRGLKQSLETMDPLAGLSKAEKREFMSRINGQDQERLDKAYHYYETVLLGQ